MDLPKHFSTPLQSQHNDLARNIIFRRFYECGGLLGNVERYGINKYEDTIGRDHMAYVVLIAEGDASDDGREDDQVNDL